MEDKKKGIKFRTCDSPAYLKSAPVGVPGDITRTDETNVEPAMLVTPFPTEFGIGMKYATGGITLPSGDAATAFAGVLVREVPSIANDLASDAVFNPSTPNQLQPQGFAVRGYVAVRCVAGTPVRGGVVYWQVTTNGSIKAGEFRADGTDSGNAVALTATQAEWATDGLDSLLNAELRIAR
jgi:hypothetical protein